MTASYYALDIETIPTTSDPDFRAPGDWRLFAIALAHTPDPETTETEILLTADDTTRAEYELIDDAIAWIQQRGYADAVLTYNGHAFDIPILDDRVRETQPPHPPDDPAPRLTAREKLHALLDIVGHRDLFRTIQSRQRRGEKWPSLEEACQRHDIRMQSARLDGRVVEGEDMIEMGERIRDPAVDSHRAEQAVEAYASEDVRVLPALARALDSDTDRAMGTVLDANGGRVR